MLLACIGNRSLKKMKVLNNCRYEHWIFYKEYTQDQILTLSIKNVFPEPEFINNENNWVVSYSPSHKKIKEKEV